MKSVIRGNSKEALFVSPRNEHDGTFVYGEEARDLGCQRDMYSLGWDIWGH